MLRYLALALCLALPAAADTVSGLARVIDGDTIEIGAVKVRLAGMDAPERDQPCGQTACGVVATEALTALIDGDVVTCDLNGGRTHDRIAGTCATAQVSDLGGAMVLAGHALNEPRFAPDYSAHAQAAERAVAGMWATPMQAAWQWRAADRTPAPDADCAIKGNISASGRIYHQPGNRSYAATRIDPARGERWFCSPAEAMAAGWRAARD